MSEQLPAVWLIFAIVMLTCGIGIGAFVTLFAMERRHSCLPHSANYCRGKYLTLRAPTSTQEVKKWPW